MSRPPGTTKIHEAGIAEDVAELVKTHQPASNIIRWAKAVHNLELTYYDIKYFSDNHVGETDRQSIEVVKTSLERKAALVDVVSMRAEALGCQWAQVERIVTMERLLVGNEKDEMWKLAARQGSRLGPELDRLNRLLDAHREDLIKLGVFKESVAQVGGDQYNIAMIGGEPVSALAMEQEMIAEGIDAGKARRIVLRTCFGADRLGEGEPTRIRAEVLDDQGEQAELRGARIPQGAVRPERRRIGDQEGRPDGDK